MSYAPFGGAEIAEVLVTVERIEGGDTDSWHEEWVRTADRVEESAEEATRAGHAAGSGRRRERIASLGARVSLESRWLLENSTWVFGVDSAAELQRTLPECSLSGVAGRIDCPTLVLAGEDDHFVPLRLAREFVEELTRSATVRVFRTGEEAGEHCQMGNLTLASDVIYD